MEVEFGGGGHYSSSQIILSKQLHLGRVDFAWNREFVLFLEVLETYMKRGDAHSIGMNNKPKGLEDRCHS